MEQLQNVYVLQFLAPGVNKVLVCFSEHYGGLPGVYAFLKINCNKILNI